MVLTLDGWAAVIMQMNSRVRVMAARGLGSISEPLLQSGHPRSIRHDILGRIFLSFVC